MWLKVNVLLLIFLVATRFKNEQPLKHVATHEHIHQIMQVMKLLTIKGDFVKQNHKLYLLPRYTRKQLNELNIN